MDPLLDQLLDHSRTRFWTTPGPASGPPWTTLLYTVPCPGVPCLCTTLLYPAVHHLPVHYSAVHHLATPPFWPGTRSEAWSSWRNNIPVREEEDEPGKPAQRRIKAGSGKREAGLGQNCQNRPLGLQPALRHPEFPGPGSPEHQKSRTVEEHGTESTRALIYSILARSRFLHFQHFCSLLLTFAGFRPAG